MNYWTEKEIEREIRLVLSALKSWLEAPVQREIDDLLRHGEFGVSYELICQMLYEVNASILLSEYQRLENLGKKLKLDPSRWSFLEKCVRK